MKVLFICKGNIGRSQMARALFDKFSKEKSDSAGTKVPLEAINSNLGDFSPAENVIKVMKEEGIDLTQKRPKQLTKILVDSSQIIISLTSKEDLPDFLEENKKVKYFELDNPKGYDLENTRRVKNQIKVLVKDLIKKLKL
jgi:arsenate reductase